MSSHPDILGCKHFGKEVVVCSFWTPGIVHPIVVWIAIPRGQARSKTTEMETNRGILLFVHDAGMDFHLSASEGPARRRRRFLDAVTRENST